MYIKSPASPVCIAPYRGILVLPRRAINVPLMSLGYGVPVGTPPVRGRAAPPNNPLGEKAMVAIATFPSANVRYAGFDNVHPLAVKAFRSLESDLIAASVIGDIPFLFKPFETYRTPQRQRLVLASGSSRAEMFRSAHQFGLAVDFVPWTEEKKWHWDVDIHWWSVLKGKAIKHGLDVPLSWDKAHVEHPLWTPIRIAMWG